MIRLEVNTGGSWFVLQVGEQILKDVYEAQGLHATHENMSCLIDRNDHPSLDLWMRTNRYNHAMVLMVFRSDVKEVPFNPKISMNSYRASLDRALATIDLAEKMWKDEGHDGLFGKLSLQEREPYLAKARNKLQEAPVAFLES